MLLKSNKLLVFYLVFAPMQTVSAGFWDYDIWMKDYWNENLQVHGFLSQGLFHSSANNVYGHSADSVSAGLTEIGLNFSYQPMQNFSVAAKGLFRRAGEVDPGSVRLDYGLADLLIYQRDNLQLGIRGGRIKLPWGLYNETRDVAFTTPSIVLPHGIYYDRSRSLLLSADGGAVYAQYNTDYGDFSFKLNYGLLLNDNKELQIAILSNLAEGELLSEPSLMGQLAYELNGGEFIFAISFGDLCMKYHPVANDWLAAGDVSIQPILFSGQYNGEKFSLTAEYNLQFNNFTNFGPFYEEAKPVSESWYIQGAYRILPQLQASIRYDQSFIERNDKGGLAQLAIGRPAYASFIKDWMFGLRWDINTSWMIRGEYHRINGTSSLGFADNPDPAKTAQYWDLFALQFSFRF